MQGHQSGDFCIVQEEVEVAVEMEMWIQKRQSQGLGDGPDAEGEREGGARDAPGFPVGELGQAMAVWSMKRPWQRPGFGGGSWVLFDAV